MISLLLILVAAISYGIGMVSGPRYIYAHMPRRVRRSGGRCTIGYALFARRFGLKWAIAAAAFDAVKSAVAAVLGLLLLNLYGDGFPVIGALFAGFCVMLGDMFPFNRAFRGGKGVLCLMTALWIADWRIGVFSSIVFIVVVTMSRYVSLASLSACLAGAVAAWIFVETEQLKAASGLVVLFAFFAAAWRHRGSIARLASGSEEKMIWGRAPEDKLREDTFV